MEAKELRIGNWVQYSGKYIQVESVDAEGINLTCDYGGIYSSGMEREVYFENWWKDGSNIAGIPLTDEILQKCGFKKSDGWKDSWLWLNGFGLNFHQGNWYWNDLSKNIKLSSVHQLQNIFFALSETELEMNFSNQ